MKIIKIIGAMAVMAMASSANAVSFVIDHFGDNPGVALSYTAGTDPAAVTQAGVMLGGFRTIDANAPGGGSNNLDIKIGATTFTGDSLEISNGVGVTGAVDIIWDGNGVGLGGVDITLGGVNDYIRVGVLSIDLTTTVALTLVDTLANSFTVGPQLFGGAGVFQVALSDFVGVDTTSIDSITMQLTGATAWDGVFDLIETNTYLPLPAPMALIGLGLVLLGLRGRMAA